MSSDRADAPVVELTDVTKVYDRHARGLRWRQALPWAEHRPRLAHRALEGVDLELRRGETVGVIGPNGAGKSTLLKLVAGVTQPTTGTVRCDGTVGAMIELGVGFHPELTGWENVRCGAVLRGIHASALDPVLGDIAEFAGLEDAMDSPIKKYSVGMRARLAFALATQFPVDVLVVDEVLAVGDPDFQMRCLDRVRHIVDQGAAVLFVSHEMRLISLMCERTLRIDDGAVVDDGATTDVVARYLKQQPTRFGEADRKALRIESYDLAPEVEPWGHLAIDARVQVTEPVRKPTVSVDLTIPTLNPDLVHVIANDKVPALQDPGTYRLRGRSHPFGFQNVGLRVSLTVGDGARPSDVQAADLRMGGDGAAWSYLAVDPEWETWEEPAAAHPPARHTGIRPDLAPDAVAVRLRDVTKAYRSGRTHAAIRAAVPGAWGAGGRHDVLALDGLDLDVERGEALGIIGPNGAGKSTLLRLVAGLTIPESGVVDVRSPVVPMLDFGSGMHPHMSGVENIRVRGRLLGIDPADLERKMDEIVAFADIGDAIHTPLHQYSSGMLARVGFAVAIHAPGEILLVDELLAVGDEAFRGTALRAIEARRREGDTVLFVSHEMQLIEQTCGRVVRLEHGRVVEDGPVTDLNTHSGGGWAAGVHDATSGIHLSDLRVRQRKITVGGSIEFETTVEVETPAPHARLELSYRAIPEDRATIITRSDRNIRSFFLKTVEPAGGILAEPGRYRVRCVAHRHQVAGGFDVVLAAVDDREDQILAESWQEVLIGQPNSNGLPIFVTDFDWTVERVDQDAPVSAEVVGD